jgi:hypothetical protein
MRVIGPALWGQISILQSAAQLASSVGRVDGQQSTRYSRSDPTMKGRAKSRSDPYCRFRVNTTLAMVRVPDRAAPVAFGSTANCTFPPPEPDPASVIVIHGTPLTAVHVHPADVPTETVPTPPAAGMACDVGLRVNVQPFSCATVTVRPATVTMPVRPGPMLAANARSTAPFPVPPAVPVIPIQPALLAAVHAHDAAAATSTRAPPPLAAAAMFSGDTANEQPVSCDTVNVCPAIITVPLRGGPVLVCTPT